MMDGGSEMEISRTSQDAKGLYSSNGDDRELFSLHDEHGDRFFCV